MAVYEFFSIELLRSTIRAQQVGTVVCEDLA